MATRIDPNGIYSGAELARKLGLMQTTIKREVRLGRLRRARVSRRTLFRGEWVLAWLETMADRAADRSDPANIEGPNEDT